MRQQRANCQAIVQRNCILTLSKYHLLIFAKILYKRKNQ